MFWKFYNLIIILKNNSFISSKSQGRIWKMVSVFTLINSLKWFFLKFELLRLSLSSIFRLRIVLFDLHHFGFFQLISFYLSFCVKRIKFIRINIALHNFCFNIWYFVFRSLGYLFFNLISLINCTGQRFLIVYLMSCLVFFNWLQR